MLRFAAKETFRIINVENVFNH